jgi:hypothetical protein
LHPIVFQALLRPRTASFNPQDYLLHRTIDDHCRLCTMSSAAHAKKDLNLFVRPPTSSQGDQVLSVYRASISRTVGLVVAPFEAVSARGQDARGFRAATPQKDANRSILAPGSMIPSVERCGRGRPPMQPMHSRALDKLARAARRTRAVVIVSAGAPSLERSRKEE